MAKVKSRTNEVYLGSMKDGDVAEVISWFNDEIEMGTVVQRYGNALIIIGKYSGESYPTIFNGGDEELNNAEVRILNSGSEIIL